MDYKETLEYMFNSLPMFQRVGGAAYKADLSNTLKLCKLLENPEKKFKSIHVAGTNGKGSSSHMIASVLQEAGYKTGLYTSPHLRDFRERIRINGKMIDENYVTQFIDRYKKEFETIGLSFFEMTVGMAFKYFEEKKVDIAILETGMGGRLDSTNVSMPEVSLITNIGLDHTQFLGNTLEEIAEEKAGIIKKNTPVIISQTQKKVKHIFQKHADEKNANIYFADAIIKTKILSKEKNYLHCKLSTDEGNFQLDLPLKGKYQVQNLQGALATMLILRTHGWKIDNSAIADGIKKTVTNTGLTGRWQTLSDNPHIICDTGHNEDGIEVILQQLKEENYQKLHFVLGMVNDKNIDKILNMLPKDAEYYFCKANIPRGLQATLLQEKAAQQGLRGNVYSGVNNALEAAKANYSEEDLIFVGGSTFTVAEVV